MAFIVKNTTFPGPLDLLAPHSCRGCGLIGSAICDRCKKYIISEHQDFCPNCKAKFAPGECPECKLPPIYYIGARNGLLDSLIHDYKYKSVRSLAPILADLLNHFLPDLPPDTVIVPLPTNSKHIRERGLDHTRLLAKYLAKKRHLKTANILLRAKNTIQVGADHNTRVIQANSAYIVNPKANIKPSATYLLLDDVWTTGATINAAIKKLQQAGAKSIKIALLAVSLN